MFLNIATALTTAAAAATTIIKIIILSDKNVKQRRLKRN
jgi:hypothetical protein